MEIISVKNFYFADQNEKSTIDSEIMQNYKKYFKPNGYNFEIKEYQTLFFNNLYETFFKKCCEMFGEFTLSSRNKKSIWCYLTNCDSKESFFHDHINTSTINGVYYYKLNENDSISFLKNNKEIRYTPEIGELIIFPNTLLHRPDTPTTKSYRCSFNVEITTEETSEEIFNRIK